MVGARFRIKSPTVAIDKSEYGSGLLHVPIDSAITVVSAGGESGFVEVEWNGRVVKMFARDLAERTERIP